jgi:hypothetical protein
VTSLLGTGKQLTFFYSVAKSSNDFHQENIVIYKAKTALPSWVDRRILPCMKGLKELHTSCKYSLKVFTVSPILRAAKKQKQKPLSRRNRPLPTFLCSAKC